MTRQGMDLTCEEMVELITDYLEGVMPAEERLRLEGHLDICEGCRNYLEQMRVTLRVARRLREEDLPSGSADRLLEAFRMWKRQA